MQKDQPNKPPDGDATLPHWEYACAKCRRTTTASVTDLIGHLRHGFPRCFGQPMSLDFLQGPDDKD
jgi:hypothetical protein